MPIISVLPDGHFTVSTAPDRALTERELRDLLMTPNADAWIVDDIIRRAGDML